MSPMRGDRWQVGEALADVQASLAVDGYRLDVEQAATDALDVRIVALDGACAECLAPDEVLKMIISGCLDGVYRPEEITVRHPASPAADEAPRTSR